MLDSNQRPREFRPVCRHNTYAIVSIQFLLFKKENDIKLLVVGPGGVEPPTDTNTLTLSHTRRYDTYN